ncbi:hypothetical protein Patl1_08539 [Pistacia atlantica]|uniref:Uncharacterized protein n=1 Tax=Pistacia atlantica TaxID=434234 RepID=A0ACC1AHR7_9ROSI|nr:hypothetical protein Patl1_08539 [Pistacia atlantica]
MSLNKVFKLREFGIYQQRPKENGSRIWNCFSPTDPMRLNSNKGI